MSSRLSKWFSSTNILFRHKNCNDEGSNTFKENFRDKNGIITRLKEESFGQTKAFEYS